MKQLIKFGIVGLSNTAISYLIYIICLKSFEQAGIFPRMDYLVSSVISFALSVLWSFYWNNKYTFKKEDGEQRSILYTLLKTYVSYAFTGLILNNILLYLWVDSMGLNKNIAPIINLIVTVPLNFILNKYWAFRKKINLRTKERTAVK